jgi:hypothetical protein
MMSGIIYEYVERLTNTSAYIGKASGFYSPKKTLENAHRRHMRGRSPVPFDFMLRQNEQAFELRILDILESETGCTLQEMIKHIEKEMIHERKPQYNCVRSTGKTQNKTLNRSLELVSTPTER